jgi:aminoglycoside phosphotransferase (APT) family kinase protein
MQVTRRKTIRSLPDAQALTRGLTSVLCARFSGRDKVTVLRRLPNGYSSTFPTEIVTCRLPDGSERRVFCKYGPRRGDRGARVSGGVEYEAEVYRRVLQPGRSSVARFHGTFSDRGTGLTGLVLDYLEGGMPVQLMPVAMRRAARWIGRFHETHRISNANPAASAIVTYDNEFYLGWSRRLLRDAAPWHREFPWLRPLCERAREWAAILIDPPLTVIHGEYYPRNIFVENGRIAPLDWESAAIAAGEIDLASLTEAWTADVVEACERSYRRSHPTTMARRVFERRLHAARLHLACRWLAEASDRLDANCNRWYLRSMRKAGLRLGLIEPFARTNSHAAWRGGP